MPAGRQVSRHQTQQEPLPVLQVKEDPVPALPYILLASRFAKCLSVGMSRESVRYGRPGSLIATGAGGREGGEEGGAHQLVGLVEAYRGHCLAWQQTQEGVGEGRLALWRELARLVDWH